MSEKEAFSLWKELYPVLAFGSGINDCAGTLWIPSHYNKKNALARITKLEKKTRNPITKKFLTAIKRDLLFEEPQHAPSEVMNAFYNHLVIEGVKNKHLLPLAEQSLNLLCTQEHILDKSWPIELKIFTVQNCSGAQLLIDTIKKSCNAETQQALTALHNRLEKWKKQLGLKLKRNDFTELYPLLKKHSKSLGRKHQYQTILKELYDHIETPAQIEKLALAWLNKELPPLKTITKKLAKRYQCKQTIEDVTVAIEKQVVIPTKKLVSETKKLRKLLQPIAHNEWVRITPKYDVRVVETPPYLVPFLPTAAMQPFHALTKPFCHYFVTTDPKRSPTAALAEIIQTIIHEEYGHCVNFLNSYTKRNPILTKLENGLDTPITEGLSFFREYESLCTFKRMLEKPKNKHERALINEIEKNMPFSEFLDTLEFIVMKWRIIRFLRALSDTRLNMDKQTLPEFVEWAHKKTGLSKKLIFDQTIIFQERPGHAPCYSLVGQRLQKYQAKAIKNGYTQKQFNTYVASKGFPARSILEKDIKKKFNL